MRLLAFETATRQLSAALWIDGELRERSADLPNSGSEVLLPWAQALLAEAGLSLSQIDGIAFGAGPGGFTGLRLACGVAQGLAYGLDCPVVPVATLQALALASGAAQVWTVLDARMNEVYSAAYAVTGECVSELCAPLCTPPAVVPASTFNNGDGIWWGAGDGFAAYGDVLRGIQPALAGVRADVHPTAAAVARLAAPVLLSGGGVMAAAAQPIYVRDKVALTTAERLARGGVR